MIRRLITLCALLPATAMLGACTTDSDESVTPMTETSFKARFQPSAALIPFPNDIWRAGSNDGTLNIYQESERFESDPLISQVEQMNLLDGFGLNSPIHVDFTDPLNEASLALGQTVFVFSVASAGAPHAPVPVTTFEVGTADFQGGRSVLEINPTAPLDPLTTYAVIVTANVQSADGESAGADAPFAAMRDAYAADADAVGDDATLTAIYTDMVRPVLTLADGAGIGAENVIAGWTFTTQSVGTSFAALQTAGIEAQTNAFMPFYREGNPDNGIYTAGELLMPSSDTDGDGTPDIGLNANVYVGAIEMPYYQDIEEPLTSHWTPEQTFCEAVVNADEEDDLNEVPASTTAHCPMPAQTTTVTVPVLLTVPNDNSGCGGIGGVSIYQHGITQNRTNLLPLAGTLASTCHAGIAIDMPLHGLIDSENPMFAVGTNPLYASLDSLAEGISEGLTEHTFNLDLINNETGEPGQDDLADPSGEYFINLESPITSRDWLRQAAANLLHVVATLPEIDYNLAEGDAGADFDALPVRFVGHSLGGITGTVFLGVDQTVDAAVLAMPGGDISELLLNSEQIYPDIEAGLAESGLTPEMRFFHEFFRNAQTLVDAGDPINYAAAAAENHNILMFEVVGGSGLAADQVVPNSSTQALGDALGLTQYGPGVHTEAAIDGWVQFVAGDHGSLLSPAASQAVTAEMQTQLGGFIASGGTQLPVGTVETSVIRSQD